MDGKGKRILEEGESSTRSYKRTARISRRTYVTEWLQRMDDSELADSPPLGEMTAPTVQPDSFSNQPALEIDQVREPLKEEIDEPVLRRETSDPLKLEPAEGDLQMLQADQLQQEISWMGEFNKNTLGSQEISVQPDQSGDSDPLKYIQEPPEENSKENPEEESEEDPEERPQDENPIEEPNGENQEEPGEEPADNEVETDENDEDENDEQQSDDDESEDQQDEDDNADDDDDEDGEVADEDIGTASPTSTITTV